MSTNSTNTNSNSNNASSSSSSSSMDAKRTFTSSLQGLFGQKKNPSPPPAEKTAVRSSLDSEVTLLEKRKSPGHKSEVRITNSERRRSGRDSSSSVCDSQRTPVMQGRGLEAGWALLARGATEDLSTLTFTSVYVQTSVLGRLAMGLTTPHSPYNYALPPSPSPARPSDSRDPQKVKEQ